MKHSIDWIYYSILTCGRYFLMSSAESTDLTVPWSFFIRILPLYVHTWEKCFVFLQFSDSWEKLCPCRHKIFVNVNLGVFTFIVLFEVLPVQNHPVALRLQTESHYDSTRFIVPRTAGFPQLVTHFNVIGCKLGVQLQDVVGKVNDGSCRVFCLFPGAASSPEVCCWCEGYCAFHIVQAHHCPGGAPSLQLGGWRWQHPDH